MERLGGTAVADIASTGFGPNDLVFGLSVCGPPASSWPLSNRKPQTNLLDYVNGLRLAFRG